MFLYVAKPCTDCSLQEKKKRFHSVLSNRGLNLQTHFSCLVPLFENTMAFSGNCTKLALSGG